MATPWHESSNIQISRVSDLMDAVEDRCGSARIDLLHFRGESKANRTLLPTLGRPSSRFAGKQIAQFSLTQEDYLLHRLRRMAYPFVGRPMTLWDTLFLARHHGLPVRLIDWTSNPLVALYFACSSPNNTHDNGVIWASRCKEIHDQYIDIFQDPMSDPREVRGVKLIFPPSVTPRIASQAGLFSIQHDPWTPLELHDPSVIDPRDFDFESLIRWEVPAASKPALLVELERLKINRRSLFPDLDGLAQGLIEQEIVRTGSP